MVWCGCAGALVVVVVKGVEICYVCICVCVCISTKALWLKENMEQVKQYFCLRCEPGCFEYRVFVCRICVINMCIIVYSMTF